MNGILAGCFQVAFINSFIGVTCTVCNVLNGWLRGQKNEHQNNIPSPKKTPVTVCCYCTTAAATATTAAVTTTVAAAITATTNATTATATAAATTIAAVATAAAADTQWTQACHFFKFFYNA